MLSGIGASCDMGVSCAIGVSCDVVCGMGVACSRLIPWYNFSITSLVNSLSYEPLTSTCKINTCTCTCILPNKVSDYNTFCRMSIETRIFSSVG